MALVNEELAGHGPEWQEYSFEWAEQLGSQKAKGPRRIVVTEEAPSGAITSFLHTASVPVTVSVEPAISREQALSIAQQRFGSPVAQSEIDLSVWRRNNDLRQGQVLKWTVTLIGERSAMGGAMPSHAQYAIDAHTGEILEELR